MSSSKTLEKAEERAFGTLLFSDDENGEWSQRLIRAYGGDELGVVLWAIVRFLGPGADSHKKLKWERSFSVPSGKSGSVLGAFEDSFLDYVRDDVPAVMERQAFQAVMRDNPYKPDFKQYCQIVNFLQDQNCAWTITSQHVRAWKDPRRALPRSPFAHIDWFFGGRVEYALIEYCLVLDIPETLLRRSTSLLPPPSKKLLAALMEGPQAKDSSSSSSSSSPTASIDVTFEVGGSASDRARSSKQAEDSSAAKKKKARALAPGHTSVPANSTLLRTTSSSSRSQSQSTAAATAAKGGLTRIKEKSISMSSSGKRDK
jgi:hypothetical protein